MESAKRKHRIAEWILALVAVLYMSRFLLQYEGLTFANLSVVSYFEKALLASPVLVLATFFCWTKGGFFKVLLFLCALVYILVAVVLGAICREDHYRFSDGSRIDVSYGDQGALGTTGFWVITYKSFGPFFCKIAKEQSVNSYPVFQSAPDGNVRLKSQ